MKARISQLHNTEQNWEKFASWVPAAGELVIYHPDDTHEYSRVKIGDGKRTLQQLDFFLEDLIVELTKTIKTINSFDAGRL
jgi:hypothetical protein